MDVQLLCAIGSSDSSYEAFAGSVRNWQAALTSGLDRSVRAADHNLGHIEKEITHQTRELQRAIAQEAAQKKAAQAWVGPLLKNLEADHGREVIAELEAVAKGKRGATREALDREINYFGSNLHRMKYTDGRKLGEPLGSGQSSQPAGNTSAGSRDPASFGHVKGDEALMCLETFWRNGRWHILFPHSVCADPSRI